MRIVHVADTHIGFAAYRKVCEDECQYKGLNQREADVYRTFEVFVDQVLEMRPDAVLHSGDLFDTVRPTNRALSFALEQLLRISEAGIPMVLIAGNHSTPRLRETGSVFRLFEHLKDVHPVYKGAYERVDIGDMAVHAVPHSDDGSFKEQLAKIERDPKLKFNVAMLHAGVVGFNVFKMNEFNEQLVESSYLKDDLDYIALGHYHDNYQVSKNAYYSGSIERFSFSEADHNKGYMVIDLETGAREFKRLPTREMLDLGPVDASGLDPTSLKARIENALSRDLEGKIVRLVVKNVSRAAYETIDFRRLREMTTAAIHFEPKFDISRDNVSIQTGNATLSSLEQEFVSYVERYPVEGVAKDAVRSKGLEYLRKELETSD